MPYIMPIGP